MLTAPRFASGSHPPRIRRRVGDYAPHPDTINVLQTAETRSNWIVPTHKPISISTSDGAEAGASRADKSQSAGGLCAPGATYRVQSACDSGPVHKKSDTNLYLLDFCNFPRMDQSEMLICFSVWFALKHLISCIITALRRKWLWR